MMLPVPYIADETIERDAEALLAQFAHARGVDIRAPIPIEDIVEKQSRGASGDRGALSFYARP